MKNNELRNHIDSCLKEMIEKQKELVKSYGLGKCTGITVTKEDSGIQFKSNGEIIVDFSAIPIGSWSDKSSSWQWAWANKSIGENSRMKSNKLKELTEITGERIFITDSPSVFDSEHVAHELLALSIKHLGAMGYYRLTFDKEKLNIYYALMEVKQLRKEIFINSNGEKEDVIDDKSAELLEKLDSYYGDTKDVTDDISDY